MKFKIEEISEHAKSSICDANLSTLVRFKPTEISNNYIYGIKTSYIQKHVSQLINLIEVK
ncbi:MAG: hypothetical protein M3156_06510 [Thermoproteota archaeon]|nr:hypothetical protein [Thermoproteota archaeon]